MMMIIKFTKIHSLIFSVLGPNIMITTIIPNMMGMDNNNDNAEYDGDG